MILDMEPPRPGYVTTQQAARLWGCSDSKLLRAMAEHKVTPLSTRHQQGRIYYWWDPATVLKVRSKTEKAPEPVVKVKTPRNPAQYVKARHTFLEGRRKIILNRIAERTNGHKSRA